MRLTILIALIGVVLSGCGVDGNGQSAMESRNALGFDAIELALPIHTVVHQSDHFAITVQTDSNLLPLIITQVVGTTLKLRSDTNFGRHLDSSLITVWLPVVRTLSLSGSAAMEAADLSASPALSLQSSGSGQLTVSTSSRTLDQVEVQTSGSGGITLASTATQLTITLAGSGSVKASGAAPTIRYSVAGAGSIDATAVMAKDGQVSIAGSGGISMTANGGAVQVSISGSGSVDFFGSSSTNVTSSGSGRLNRH